MLKLRPYKIGSKSAKLLAQALQCLRIINPNYRQKRRDLIVNWGNTRDFRVTNPARVLNSPQAVARASNKLVALKVMREAGVSIPDFTTSRDEAAGWLRDGHRVVVRTLLSSHSGNGIKILEEDEGSVPEVPYAPLYTKYFKRDREYRVHVFKGQVIDHCQKKKRNGYEQFANFNRYIRTAQFGWVYCRDGVALPTNVSLQAVRAVSALGLDFGACDILYRDDNSTAVVLEVNTAPGIEGTTLEKYKTAISGMYTPIRY